MTQAHDPIIILGMHRSGTSILVKMIEELGLFTGHKLDENQESLFFLQLNNWLMRQSGGAWDNPEVVRQLSDKLVVRKKIANYLREFIDSPKIAEYLGLWNYLAYGSLKSFPKPWGWKDPRSSITLPFWLELFPNAKVINICRNGIDVASSLRVRSFRDLDASKDVRKVFGQNFWLLPSRYYLRQNMSLSCLSLDSGFALWEVYFDAAREAKHRAASYLEIHYEDFVDNPHKTLTALTDFCSLDAKTTQLEALAATIDKQRALAFLDNPELITFARSVEKRLNQRGYQLEAEMVGVAR